MTVQAPKQIGLVEDVADMPTGGAIALATAARSEQLRLISVNQTTAGQTITIPAPTDATIKFALTVVNIGSVDFSMYGATVTAGAQATYAWNGTAWVPDVMPAGLTLTYELLTPTGQNTIPDLANAPRAGTIQIFTVNGVNVNAGISVSGAGVFTVVPATVGYNIEVTDEVGAYYYV